MSSSLTAGMRKGGKSWDRMRSGEGMEKQSGGGSRGRLRSGGKDSGDERSSNCGSHGGGSSNEDDSCQRVGVSTSAATLLSGDKNRMCVWRDIPACSTTLRQSTDDDKMMIHTSLYIRRGVEELKSTTCRGY